MIGLVHKKLTLIMKSKSISILHKRTDWIPEKTITKYQQDVGKSCDVTLCLGSQEVEVSLRLNPITYLKNGRDKILLKLRNTLTGLK